MGEFNDTILESGKWQKELSFLLEMYREVSFSQNDAVKGISESERKVILALIHNSCENYDREMKKLRITGKGDIYYNDDLYHDADAIASIIKQHVEILTNILESTFRGYQKILGIQKEYEKFLNAFVKYRKLCEN